MLFSAATTAAVPGTQFMPFISILNVVEMNVFLCAASTNSIVSFGM